MHGKIDTLDISTHFKAHLELENNNRIIFSGKFGVGKTFFIKEFFSAYSEKYNAITISPSKYTVSANEDIFELIKVDIIMNLFCNHDLSITKFETSKVELITNFLNQLPFNLSKFFLVALKNIDPIGSFINWNIFESILQSYKDYEKEIMEKKTNSQVLSEYLDRSLDIKGNFFENNFITRTIIAELRGVKKNNKKNVLIIDDLDRIDPEHIFRIMNIMSAHNDYLLETNKFEFDHIILVCDIENIKHIYHHKYGPKVDFHGYVDKFYSYDIFYYSNMDAVSLFIREADLRLKNEREEEFYRFIFSNLIESNQITLRKLVKYSLSFELKDFIYYEQNGLDDSVLWSINSHPDFLQTSKLVVHSQEIKILRFFKLMNLVYGDFSSFLRALEIMSKQLIGKKAQWELISEVFLFVAEQFHLLSARNDSLFITKVIKHDDLDRTNYVSKVYFPTVRIHGIDCLINLKWNFSNQYDGSQLYFDNSVTEFVNKKMVFSNSEFSISKLIDTLYECAIIAYKARVLERIGINARLNEENEMR
ncbi:KAP family P-loop domain-containing protein [Chitinophaga sp. YR627]|uniref:P-loop NTPase fold protein n=1 Tax=Chitinophaga sp. YR627 TaxID=1881041 RepID=UPI0008E86D8E|nr:P-loop NTPase fold protein [Chitinophaga sp. YR627]SFO84741.1 KAP family P-loop domain-containing protein [Chitinophaga sp. YR627]